MASRKKVTPPNPARDGVRAAFQIFMNRNDSLTDDAVKWFEASMREARAKELEALADEWRDLIYDANTPMQLLRDRADVIRRGEVP